MCDQPGNFEPPPRQQQISRYGPPPPHRTMVHHLDVDPRHVVTITEDGVCRFDVRGPHQVNAVAQGRDMQVAHLKTVECVLDSGSQITNLATGELKERLLDDVEYVPNAKPGTTLKFVMTSKIHRLSVKKVTDVMVMVAVKCKMDSNKSMGLLHQCFGHMGMSTVKLLANKLDVGVEINAKYLSSYDCVACAAGKAKCMNYARDPVRKFKSLETLMMDICSMSEPPIDGATMFMFIMDECTRYKWTYLLKKKSDAVNHKVLLNRLARQFPGKSVLHLR
ncbi:hypothetical protein PR003_g5178 [Phytophthora rubi]|uniref:GAG-pre-integrase domain-containing protein n=2 Tax=Phytophthora rubi TaxID=129364 RepID=A0A6A4G518_9STRA|nr:hypothetical protein PR003_g5178 [Phytophthora rubi]